MTFLCIIYEQLGNELLILQETASSFSCKLHLFVFFFLFSCFLWFSISAYWMHKSQLSLWNFSATRKLFLSKDIDHHFSLIPLSIDNWPVIFRLCLLFLLSSITAPHSCHHLLPTISFLLVFQMVMTGTTPFWRSGMHSTR